LWQPGFIASFAIGIVVIFGGTLIYRVASGHHLTDASIDGLNAGYANVGYIGFPLCELIFGRQSLALVTIATILTVSVLFAIAIIFVEIGLQTERRVHHLFAKIGKALIRNPLLVAPLLGVLWSTFHTPVPEAAKVVLHMLGGAASPCALVSLGLFLAAEHRGSRSSRPIAVALTGLKLIIQPVIVAICAYGIFKLQPVPAAIVVLLSALPTGTGPFMVAEFYKREAAVTSRTILFTTMASVISLTACLVLVGHAQY
jgi:predicted permease